MGPLVHEKCVSPKRVAPLLFICQDVDLFVAEARCGLDCANQAGISGSYALLFKSHTSIVNDLISPLVFLVLIQPRP